MAPNLRVAKAFRAMRDLGIPEEKTKPVLKSLIKIYEKNWELIEEENYRALVDAIFDREEAEAAEQKKKLENAESEKKKELEQAERMKAIEEETQIEEEPERPLKRQRFRHQDGQASPSGIDPSMNSSETLLKRPKLEVDELPEDQPQLQSLAKTAVTEPVTWNDSQPVSPLKRGSNKGKQPISPNALALLEGSDASQSVDVERTHPIVADATDSEPAILSRRPRDKGKEPLSPQSAPRENISTSDKPSSAVRFKEPKVEPGIDVMPKQKALALIKPKDEPLTDDPPRFEVPLAVITPDSLTNGDTFTENNLVREPDDFLPLISGSTEIVDFGSDSTGEPPVGIHDIPPKDPLETCAVDGKCMSSSVNGSISTKGGVQASSDGVGDLLHPVTESIGNDCDKQIEQNNFENAESESLVVVSNNHLTPDDTRSIGDVNDIAKGQEKQIISLVNEVNSERPPFFLYIPRNTVFQNAYVNFSLSRILDDNCCPTCYGDCLTSSTPCPCALQCGGEFAYTTEGLVKEELLDECIKMNRDPQKRCLYYCKECPLERSKNVEILEPCKGHPERSFIKECWLKCGCNKQCGNRVVQCGIRHKLQVFMTSGGKGWGLRTLEDLPKGAFICEYVGEVVTTAELYNRVSQNSNKGDYAHPVLLDADWGAMSELKEEEALCLDATDYGNVARFINHRCFDPNLVEIPVEVENPDRHYYHLAFFTTREVKALEELTRDYGINFDDDNHPVKAFECHCDSQFCRNIKKLQ